MRPKSKQTVDSDSDSDDEDGDNAKVRKNAGASASKVRDSDASSAGEEIAETDIDELGTIVWTVCAYITCWMYGIVGGWGVRLSFKYGLFPIVFSQYVFLTMDKNKFFLSGF